MDKICWQLFNCQLLHVIAPHPHVVYTDDEKTNKKILSCNKNGFSLSIEHWVSSENLRYACFSNLHSTSAWKYFIYLYLCIWNETTEIPFDATKSLQLLEISFLRFSESVMYYYCHIFQIWLCCFLCGSHVLYLYRILILEWNVLFWWHKVRVFSCLLRVLRYSCKNNSKWKWEWEYDVSMCENGKYFANSVYSTSNNLSIIYGETMRIQRN